MSPTDISTIVSAIAGLISAVAASLGIWIAYHVHRNQQLLSQRQLLVPLWEYISTLNAIDPEKPVIPDIIKAVNTLELVALCCEGEMVDESVIKRTFRHDFITLYRSISSCKKLPGLEKSGDDLLLEARAASSFYEKLKREHLNSDKIPN
ncbi:MAG: hypothetical protein PHI11_02280 [Gallionella sp.]|nr:hypothetical protein [Gallionella sp.]